jgi:hypothetical protein
MGAYYKILSIKNVRKNGYKAKQKGGREIIGYPKEWL